MPARASYVLDCTTGDEQSRIRRHRSERPARIEVHPHSGTPLTSSGQRPASPGGLLSSFIPPDLSNQWPLAMSASVRLPADFGEYSFREHGVILVMASACLPLPRKLTAWARKRERFGERLVNIRRSLRRTTDAAPIALIGPRLMPLACPRHAHSNRGPWAQSPAGQAAAQRP